MSDQPRGKDGFARVRARIKQEYKIWRRAVQPFIDRWKRAPWSGHAFTNIWTEGARVARAAYFNGHLITYSLVLNLVLALLLWWRW